MHENAELGATRQKDSLSSGTQSTFDWNPGSSARPQSGLLAEEEVALRESLGGPPSSGSP